MTPTRMPMRTATTVTFFYALGYPIANISVDALSPMLVLALRFGLAGTILGVWALVARVRIPTGRTLAHVAVAGLLMQAVQFCALYLAVQRGAPAVLSAVVIAMNPVATALLSAAFLHYRLTPARIVALVLGVAAVLAASAARLIESGGVDPAVGLLLVALLGLAAGGVYQQRFCSGVDFRASTSVQNLVALLPALALTLTAPVVVHDVAGAVLGVAGVVLLNAVVGVSLYVRAINLHGASSVTMLFCVIPAVAGGMSWLMLGEHLNIGIGVGLALGALACWLNARAAARSGGQERSDPGSDTGGQERSSGKQGQDDPADDGRGQHRVDAVHDASVPR